VNEQVRTRRGLDLATAAELGDLLHELSHDKKARKALGKLIKEVKPDSPHAAAFADVDVEDRFEEFKQQQEQRELKREQDAILARMNAKRSALLTGGDDGSGPKYTEDDVKKIEALMQQKGITDYDDGRILYTATLPPESPQPSDLPTPHGATWEFPTIGNQPFAEFAANPERASRNMAHQVITEFMRKR
jgi:hypothetical protein